MFDFLKGGKATLQVQLDRIGQPYREGETIHATVTVQGEKDLKIQDGRLALIYREKYQYREESGLGDDSSTTAHWATEDLEVWHTQFYGETTVKSNTNDKFEYDIPIPPNSPASGEGAILQTTWLVKAVLNRKMASDIVAESEIKLLHPPPGRLTTPGKFGHSTGPRDAELEFILSGKEFVLGDTVAGQLLAHPNKEFDVSEIRIELAQVENVPRGEGNTKIKKQAVKLAGGTKLKPGQDLSLPFELKIPTTALVTTETRHGKIQWILRGVLARRLSSDTQVEEELFIYGGRPVVSENEIK